jgi:hypothetical protein
MKRVAFATSQDQQWTLSSWKLPDCSRQLAFKGKLYVVANYSIFGGPQILQIDPPLQGDILLPPKLIVATYPVHLPGAIQFRGSSCQTQKRSCAAHCRLQALRSCHGKISPVKEHRRQCLLPRFIHLAILLYPSPPRCLLLLLATATLLFTNALAIMWCNTISVLKPCRRPLMTATTMDVPHAVIASFINRYRVCLCLS